MEDSLPLHVCHVQTLSIFINRSHVLLHSIALAFLIYYRISFLFQDQDPNAKATHLFLPWLLVFASELLLSFIWLLDQAFRWRPVTRTVFPERLPEDDKLPAIDVFICTTDPDKEPTVEVMNSVLSAMALDYPPEKLHVYLSDDGESPITLYCMKEARSFARWWLPFCRKYRIKTRSPEAYFSGSKDDDEGSESSEFMSERRKIQERYVIFKESIANVRGRVDGSRITARDHPSLIEVIQDNSNDKVQVNQVKIPLLVYVAREKRPSHSHHFKAGALNVLQRVSCMISNSPYILVLDCDMYCNDPTSARRAMCFHLDSKISPLLAFVQFPQRFHNISKSDVYDSQLRMIFSVQWQGIDGLQGPILSGTGFYMKRVSLCGRSIQDIDLEKLKQSFGSSNELIKSLRGNNKSNALNVQHRLLEQTQLLASCTYEKDTKWGKEVGFLYDSVVEDYFTGFTLHCKGWTSVYCDPLRPQFLGSGTTNLNDCLIQGMRWSSGLAEVGFSKFCPLIYGPPRMSIFVSMCYGYYAFLPLLYFLPLWCFATIPQLCLLNDVPLYPKVSNSYFVIFLFIFLSSISKHLQEVLSTGGSFQTWRNEQRIWMMKSITSHLYGSLDAIMKRIGMREASFLPTNKVEDAEQVKLYKIGKFDFQTSNMFLVPMISLIILNVVSFIGGLVRVIFVGNWDRMLVQVFISFYILVMNFPIIEAMIIRKDKGRVRPSVTILSAMFSTIFLLLGCIILCC
ncbi:cellulose synthase-like protein G2 [Quercus suber]|uniref:cellulose synthase-like protein G2 n=1 Tax=Quercus suber TaxID=58331 RepID=UPI000CE17CC4|nr:cellulose synthase-like protein G2 [Quercus suber]